MDRLDIDFLPTFPNGISITLGKINYFFGKNGTGKSSICNYIKNHNQELIQDNQEVLVFDEQFKNTNIVDGMNGIYTIGEENSEILSLISTIENGIDDLKKEIKELEESNSESSRHISNALERIVDLIWDEKKRLESEFDKNFFKGFNNDKSKFTEHLLKNKTELLHFEEVDKINDTYNVFKKPKPSIIQYIDKIGSIDENESFGIFKDPIVNHSENQLSVYYNKLQDLDWVSNGRKYINDDSPKQCPFCQHPLSETFFDEFKAIFDNCYQESLDRLTKCCSYLNSEYEKIESVLEIVADLNLNNVDLSNVHRISLAIKDKIGSNRSSIEKKNSEPSIGIDLLSLNDEINELNSHITTINEKIKENNNVISQWDELESKIRQTLWKLIIVHRLKDIEEYEKLKNELTEKIKETQIRISELKQCIAEKEKELEINRNKVTNVTKVIDNINHALANFGFDNFSLVSDSTNPGTYRITRPNHKGESLTTLSEGEFNLVSFLYFYNLVKGSLNKSHIYNKIVILDDPVNSMDSGIMHIVASLVKSLFSDCHVDQILIFTHNVFFHKEIEKKSKRDKTNYFVLNKENNITKIKQSSKSEIHSIYEQIWMEYGTTSNPITSFNCMRRILEYYFRTLIGEDKYDSLREQICDDDLILFDLLINYSNSGSHSVFEPIETYIDESNVEHCKSIFKKIFEISGNISHYNMMMKNIEN